MNSLDKLSPAALKAAMTTGTVGWAQWGSAQHHAMYVEPLSYPTRRMCRCGCHKRMTHKACANGMALATGCEMEVRRFVRQYGGKP